MPSALPNFPRPPKRSRLLCMRSRLRNPSLWPRVGVSFYLAKYVATTKETLIMSVEAQAAVPPAQSHLISLFHRI